MDAAGLAASWAGVAITTVGLGSLITQARVIQSQLDPFHESRGPEHIGKWSSLQLHSHWYSLVPGPPRGPFFTGSLSEGFCGQHHLYLSQETIRVDWKSFMDNAPSCISSKGIRRADPSIEQAHVSERPREGHSSK